MKNLWTDFRAVPQLLPVLLVVLAVPGIFYAATVSMVNIWWTNETFTHGFLILPIALWLVWDRRQLIADIPMERDLTALICLLPTLGLWVAATLIDVAVVQQLVTVALIPLSVWLLLGRQITLAILFPLLYLFFLVPLGQSLIPPMMELTADFTVFMVQLSGVPVFRDGLSFQLPSGNWSVVEECSGVRYLISSAALGSIYAYITYQSFTKRSVFFLASLIVPVLANGLRAYGIVMIGHLSGMKYAVGVDHLLYGWVFFGVVIFVLFWVGGFWAEPTQTVDENQAATGAKPTAPSPRFAVVVASCMLVISVGLNAYVDTAPTLPKGATLVLPDTAGRWQQLTHDSSTQWAPLIQNPDLLSATTFTDGSAEVGLHIGYFHSQRPGAEAISSLNRLSNPYGGDWKLIASRAYQQSQQPVRESELSYRADKALVWSFYLVDDKFVANAYIAKLYEAKALLLGRRHAGFITLSTKFDAPLATLQHRLENAWSDLGPVVRESVNSAAKTRIDD